MKNEMLKQFSIILNKYQDIEDSLVEIEKNKECKNLVYVPLLIIHFCNHIVGLVVKKVLPG